MTPVDPAHVDTAEPEQREIKPPKPRRHRPRKTCPRCRSNRVLPIIYGLPGSELAEREAAGEVVLGGCVLSGDDPRQACVDCGHSW